MLLRDCSEHLVLKDGARALLLHHWVLLLRYLALDNAAQVLILSHLVVTNATQALLLCHLVLESCVCHCIQECCSRKLPPMKQISVTHNSILLDSAHGCAQAHTSIYKYRN